MSDKKTSDRVPNKNYYLDRRQHKNVTSIGGISAPAIWPRDSSQRMPRSEISTDLGVNAIHHSIGEPYTGWHVAWTNSHVKQDSRFSYQKFVHCLSSVSQVRFSKAVTLNVKTLQWEMQNVLLILLLTRLCIIRLELKKDRPFVHHNYHLLQN